MSRTLKPPRVALSGRLTKQMSTADASHRKQRDDTPDAASSAASVSVAFIPRR